jgi:hypothetical protein
MYGISDVFLYASDHHHRNPRKGVSRGALLDPGLHRLTLRAADAFNDAVPCVSHLRLAAHIMVRSRHQRALP